MFGFVYLFNRYGRYNTCRRLLESVEGPNIINETDADGLSALHLAALNGHTKIINLLLQKGASVTRYCLICTDPNQSVKIFL